MTRPLKPSEFAEAVADYADGVEDEQFVRMTYAGQLVAVASTVDHSPADPVDFAAALVAGAGVDVDDLDRERIEHAYQQQIERARDFAGGKR